MKKYLRFKNAIFVVVVLLGWGSDGFFYKKINFFPPHVQCGRCISAVPCKQSNYLTFFPCIKWNFKLCLILGDINIIYNDTC